MFDLILKNGIIVTSVGKVAADLAVSDGRVAAWLGRGDISREAQAENVIDCNGKYLLPGIVDMHFHCRVPGASEREDFDTATMAAAKGGVTMIAEMPIANPSPHGRASFDNRVKYASDKAVVDFAFYGAGATKDANTAKELAEAGAIGFKLFLHKEPAGREMEFKSLCCVSSEELFHCLKANGETGLITCVHAEDDGLIRALTSVYGKGSKNSFNEQLMIRVPEAEELAIIEAGLIAEKAAAKVHICHISSMQGLEALKYLKKKGIEITGETCPQYVFSESSLMTEFGTYAKVNPPIRDEGHQNSLLDALKKGVIEIIASDHAPFLPWEKEVEDFLKAPSGMPVVELFGPMVFDRAVKGEISWEDAVRWTSMAPAKLLGLYPFKGSLSVGADADFIIFDEKGVLQVDINECLTKSRESLLPFESRSYKGSITATYVRGCRVYENKKIHAARGFGKFVPGSGYGGAI